MYNIHPFGKLSLFVYIYGLYELALQIRRKANVIATYQQAIKRAHDAGKKLLVLGSVPTCDTDYHDDKSTLKFETTQSILDFFKRTPFEQLNNFVIFEHNMLPFVQEFKTVETCLKQLKPEDLFFVPREWYSIFAYVNFANALCENGKGPEKVFIFYPPRTNFVYMRNNPFKDYNRLICGCIITFLTLWIMLLGFNA